MLALFRRLGSDYRRIDSHAVVCAPKENVSLSAPIIALHPIRACARLATAAFGEVSRPLLLAFESQIHAG